MRRCFIAFAFTLLVHVSNPAGLAAEASVEAMSEPAADSAELTAMVERMAKVGGCWSPSFSPDGTRVAFVSDLSGVPQIWTVDVAGGWPDRVTALDDQIGGVTWSPDGQSLAFSLAPGGGMNQQIYTVAPDGSDLRRLTDGGRDNNWLGRYRHDGRWLAFASNRGTQGSIDAWLFDVEQGTMRRVAENPGIGFLADFSRDGHRASLYRMASRSDNNLYLVDLATGDEQLITPHEPPGSFNGGVFSPDGRTVYLSSNKDRDRVAFARVRLDGSGKVGPIEVLAGRDDAELQTFVLSHDGTFALLVWNASGRSELARYDLRTGAIAPIQGLPAEIVGDLELSRDDTRAVMTLSGAARPRDLWTLELGEHPVFRQLTRSPHAGVDLGSLVTPELVTYSAHDGEQLSGWLYRPAGDDGSPAPYVLSFHGGPEGQSRPSFRSDFQALVAQGIGVFAPNVRGSSGFGKRFVNLDNGALRFDGVKDIESTVHHLVSREIADPKRIGIMGGSYGGYMTMAGLAWYPDLFAAGANLFGVVNFETFFEHTEPWMAAISKVEYGDPDTEKELLRKLSPIHAINSVVAPTIVLHGANDTNVPVVEAEQVVENLEDRGVPVEYVLFPDEGHGFRKTVNRTRSTVAIVQWFSRYLLGETSSAQGP